MTQLQPTDVNKYLATIRINFENAYNTQTPEERQILLKSWYEILKEYPKEVCDNAVINAIKYAKFAPRIGDIVEQIEKMRTAYEKTDGELWTELTGVLKKVSRIMYFGTKKHWYNGKLIDPTEEVNKIYETIDPILQTYVGDVSGLVELSRAETLDYEKGRFIKNVETLRGRERTKQETPLALAGIVKELSGGMAITGGGTKLLKGAAE